MVITTVSFFETVAPNCAEGRFQYKTTAISRISRSFVTREIVLVLIMNSVNNSEK